MQLFNTEVSQGRFRQEIDWRGREGWNKSYIVYMYIVYHVVLMQDWADKKTFIIWLGEGIKMYFLDVVNRLNFVQREKKSKTLSSILFKYTPMSDFINILTF